MDAKTAEKLSLEAEPLAKAINLILCDTLHTFLGKTWRGYDAITFFYLRKICSYSAAFWKVRDDGLKSEARVYVRPLIELLFKMSVVAADPSYIYGIMRSERECERRALRRLIETTSNEQILIQLRAALAALEASIPDDELVMNDYLREISPDGRFPNGANTEDIATKSGLQVIYADFWWLYSGPIHSTARNTCVFPNDDSSGENHHHDALVVGLVLFLLVKRYQTQQVITKEGRVCSFFAPELQARLDVAIQKYSNFCNSGFVRDYSPTVAP